MRGLYPEVVGTTVILEHATGLANVGRHVPLETQVATCPGWSIGDLVWHLAEVEHFWAHVIGQRPGGPDTYQEPVRPPDAELVVTLERSAAELARALDEADPSESAWSWSDDHTVGFTLRRQSHEAVVHHVDGRLAAGAHLPAIDPRLAADGVDELIDVMLTGVPSWATFERRGGVIELRIRETDDSWIVALGRMTGTSPESGQVYDLGALELVDEPSDTVVEGDAADLHLWLCGRGDVAALEVRGDRELTHELRTIASDV